VQDYLAVYQQALSVPHRAEKLAEELGRVSSGSKSGDLAEKKARLNR
jgi:hypothetical protein